MASDPAIQAAYGRAFARPGVTVPVTITRVTGVAPNTSTVSAAVRAVVRNYMANTTAVEETGYAASKIGALTQGDRLVILLESDLFAQNFPLPMRKHDRITLGPGNVLDVTMVDPFKRNAGGAIELKATGVS